MDGIKKINGQEKIIVNMSVKFNKDVIFFILYDRIY